MQYIVLGISEGLEIVEVYFCYQHDIRMNAQIIMAHFLDDT